MQNVSFHILGAGSIGRLWAHHFDNAGIPYALIGRNPSDLALNFKLFSSQGEFDKSMSLTTATQLTQVNRWLVCVKSYQLGEALQSIRHTVTKDTVVILLQNGMGNDEIAHAILPECRLLLCSNTHGVYRSDQQLVYAGAGHTIIGPAQEGLNLTGIPECLSQMHCALPDVIWRQDIQTVLWQKLAINAAINPLTVKFNCKNGDLLTVPEYQQTLTALIDEMIPTIHHFCPQLHNWDFYLEIERVAKLTASNYSSMQQDVANGRPTEILSITGFLVQKSRQIGLHLPRHEDILSQLI